MEKDQNIFNLRKLKIQNSFGTDFIKLFSFLLNQFFPMMRKDDNDSDLVVGRVGSKPGGPGFNSCNLQTVFQKLV